MGVAIRQPKGSDAMGKLTGLVSLGAGIYTGNPGMIAGGLSSVKGSGPEVEAVEGSSMERKMGAMAQKAPAPSMGAPQPDLMSNPMQRKLVRTPKELEDQYAQG